MGRTIEFLFVFCRRIDGLRLRALLGKIDGLKLEVLLLCSQMLTSLEPLFTAKVEMLLPQLLSVHAHPSPPLVITLHDCTDNPSAMVYTILPILFYGIASHSLEITLLWCLQLSGCCLLINMCTRMRSNHI